METLRLEFNPSIKAKILEVLSVFNNEELHVIHEDPNFLENKRKLDIERAKIKNGTAELCDIDELELYLDEIISKYEN
jgi:hypothetical protein